MLQEWYPAVGRQPSSVKALHKQFLHPLAHWNCQPMKAHKCFVQVERLRRLSKEAGMQIFITCFKYSQSLHPKNFLQPHQREKGQSPNIWQHFKSNLVSYCRSFALLAPSICNCICENQHTETRIIFPHDISNQGKGLILPANSHWMNPSVCSLQAGNSSTVANRKIIKGKE